MKTLLLIALRNLLVNRRRSLLLGGAIALVTVLLVVLSSVSGGMQTNMLKVATTLATGHVNVGGFYKLTSGDATPMLSDYPPLLELLKAQDIGVAQVVVRGRGWGKVVSHKASQQGALVGIDIGNEPTFREVVTVVGGDIGDLAQPDAIMLFEKQAHRLEVKAGDPVTVSAPTFRGVNNTVDLKVVAVAKDMGFQSSFSLFMSAAALRRLYDMQDKMTGALHVFLEHPERAEEVAAKLRARYAEAGYRVMEPSGQPFWQKFQSVSREDWTGQKLDISTWTDEMQFMKYTLQTFDLLTVIFIAVLLGIIVLGVVNTMVMAIRERTREIGTLRAIGMGRKWVLGMFVVEAAVLSYLSTAAGCVAGGILVAALNAAHIQVSDAFQMFLMSDTLKLEMDVATAAIAIVVIGTVTTIGSLWPSWRAANKPPVTAIQHV